MEMYEFLLVLLLNGEPIVSAIGTFPSAAECSEERDHLISTYKVTFSPTEGAAVWLTECISVIRVPPPVPHQPP